MGFFYVELLFIQIVLLGQFVLCFLQVQVGQFYVGFSCVDIDFIRYQFDMGEFLFFGYQFVFFDVDFIDYIGDLWFDYYFFVGLDCVGCYCFFNDVCFFRLYDFVIFCFFGIVLVKVDVQANGGNNQECIEINQIIFVYNNDCFLWVILIYLFLSVIIGLICVVCWVGIVLVMILESVSRIMDFMFIDRLIFGLWKLLSIILLVCISELMFQIRKVLMISFR